MPVVDTGSPVLPSCTGVLVAAEIDGADEDVAPLFAGGPMVLEFAIFAEETAKDSMALSTTDGVAAATSEAPPSKSSTSRSSSSLSPPMANSESSSLSSASTLPSSNVLMAFSPPTGGRPTSTSSNMLSSSGSGLLIFVRAEEEVRESSKNDAGAPSVVKTLRRHLVPSKGFGFTAYRAFWAHNLMPISPTSTSHFSVCCTRK